MIRVSTLLLLATLSLTRAEELSTLCADRAAVERVYYQHRLGEKPPFEETLPRAMLERLVRDDLRKETALKKAYGIEITPTMLGAEIERINTTTRAPEILAEIKAALGNDTNRFARTVAKPIVVERLLRDKFENDAALHLPQRREAERMREQLLTAKTRGETVTNLLSLLRRDHSNQVTETTWLLVRRPPEANLPSTDEIRTRQRFGPQAQLLSAPSAGESSRDFYFDDLPPALQNVLRVQLRQPGDVSAVIELPTGFALYLLKTRTAEEMSVATLSLPKRSYEQWLAE